MSSLYSFLLLPQNYLAEEILIGSTIINPNLLIFLIKNIDIDYFFIESHKIIYRNLITIQQDSHIDPVELIYSLQKNKVLQKIGGIKAVTELVKQGQVFNASNNINFYIKQIIRIIQSNYNRRLIIQYGYNIIKLAYNHELSNYTLTIKASQYLNCINSYLNTENLDNLQELVGALIHNIKQTKKTYLNKNNIALYSGFKDIDILTNGLPQGDLIVIAGRPSMGKTSLVMNITYHLLKYFHTQICVFSLEMTKIQILHKLISIGSGLTVNEIISNKVNKEKWHTIQEVCNDILVAKLYINENPNISVDEIKYISQIIIEKNVNNNIIIIDYLQLLHEKNSNIDNRSQELSYITRKLKILAQTLKVPIIILSQLNRSIEKRINKQPLLSDLKESGCISTNNFIHDINNNNLHIKTINQYLYQIATQYLSYRNNSNKIFIQKNITKKIYLINQYIFRCIINNIKTISITHNHRCLSNKNWIKESQLEQSNTLVKLHNCQNNIKFHRIEKVYLKQILFWQYNIAYDINKYKYCNFICETIVLHNSIEQDADIVMMLYRDTNNLDDTNSTKVKLLDITISKNRNGPIGELKLNFDPRNTIFTSAINTYK